ncbi:MAG TPA: hypothetical protein VJ456_00040 [Acidimicrobiia bacterium]|nr:hypothetical protein [Acidimicrobiia bacterium]
MAASARAPEGLYGLPLEEFTPARDALAKELRAAGRKDEAAEVKALRKPSVAAWALNRVARDHPDAIERLRAAGADLREAQNEAMSGDAGRLRAAGRALAEAIDRVAALAADALRAAGRPVSAAQQEKIVATLRTAAVDDDAGEALTRGVLVDDLEPTGFSLLGPGSGDLSAGDGADGAGGVAPLPGAHRPARKPKPSKEALEAVEAARRELRRCDAEAEMAATRARRRAERAETAMQRAAEAHREADEARAAAEEAAGEAEAARRRAAEAADAQAAAEAALPT